MPNHDAAIAIKALNLDLTQEERDILYEFTRARQIMETLNTPGWEHIQDFMDSRVATVETLYLKQRNITPDALYAMHIAVQYVQDFIEALKSQLRTTGDWLKDPQAVEMMLRAASQPEEEDLEGELSNEFKEEMPRFPEDKA